jgi:saccharopine dehydrogenase (NAD+, L-lysine-forming)
VTFKYGLGEEFIDVLRTLHKLGLDSTDKVRVGGVEVSALRRTCTTWSTTSGR